MRVRLFHSRYLSGPASGENQVVDDEALLLERAGHLVERVILTPSAADAGATLAFRSFFSGRARRAARQGEADVVHFHNLFPMVSPAAISAAANVGIPTAMTLHNFRLMCLPATFLRESKICTLCQGRIPLPGITHGCYRASVLGSAALGAALTAHRALGTFDSVTRFFAVSEFVRRRHVEAGFAPERIVVKPNFAWESPRRGRAGAYFLYAGRLSVEKGMLDVVTSWRRAVGRLVVLGDGPQFMDARRAAAPGVDLRGAVEPAVVRQTLLNARALLVPSLCFEGAPRVIVEAFAAGVPVVASRIGGLPELVEDEFNGLLFAAGDMDALAAAIERLAEDSEVERLGQGALQSWERRYSPERALAALEDCYAQTISAATSKRHEDTNRPVEGPE